MFTCTSLGFYCKWNLIEKELIESYKVEHTQLKGLIPLSMVKYLSERDRELIFYSNQHDSLFSNKVVTETIKVEIDKNEGKLDRRLSIAPNI